MHNIFWQLCFLQHCYMFRCLHIIRGVFFVYAKVTKWIKWKRLNRWFLQKINQLKLPKCSTSIRWFFNSLNASFVTEHITLLRDWWLYIQSTESRNVFDVGSILHWMIHYNKSMKWWFRNVKLVVVSDLLYWVIDLSYL